MVELFNVALDSSHVTLHILRETRLVQDMSGFSVLYWVRVTSFFCISKIGFLGFWLIGILKQLIQFILGTYYVLITVYCR